MICGEPGSGKTVMGLEILYRAALNGDAGIMLSLEETPQALRQNALTLGFDLPALEAQGKLLLMEGKTSIRGDVEGDFGLEPMMAIISGKAHEMGAKRVMLDALDVLLGLMKRPSRVRAELHLLADWLSDSGLTTIMTLKPRETGPSKDLRDFFYSMSDCVLALDVRVMNQVSTRRLRVIKYRGSDLWQERVSILHNIFRHKDPSHHRLPAPSQALWGEASLGGGEAGRASGRWFFQGLLRACGWRARHRQDAFGLQLRGEGLPQG